MTDQTITLQPNAVQTISAQLAQATTITNQSTTESIWISSLPSVAVGNGQKVGALGSLQWAGGPCYGIVDGSAPANVRLSSSVSQIVDPVSVAQAINAAGVPNVLSGGSVPVPGDGQWQVGQYASLSINLLTSGNGILKIAFFPPNNANPIYQETYTIGQGINGFLLVTNVYGSVMTITAQGGGFSVTNLVVYGSNRAVPRDKLVPSTLMLNAGLTQIYNANTRYTLQSVVTPGGLATLNFRASAGLITAANVATSWGFEYYDSIAGSLQFQNIVNNKAFTADALGNYGWTGEFLLPPGVISFQVSNDNIATVNATAVMTGTLPS